MIKLHMFSPFNNGMIVTTPPVAMHYHSTGSHIQPDGRVLFPLTVRVWAIVNTPVLPHECDSQFTEFVIRRSGLKVPENCSSPRADYSITSQTFLFACI